MKSLWMLASALLLSAAGAAFAQRTDVPLRDFKAISVERPSNAGIVKAAIVHGALTQSWDIVESPDGSLVANTDKDGTDIKVRFTYDATSYSLTYVESTGLRYSKEPDLGKMMSSPKLYADAEASHERRFSSSPDSPFVVKAGGYIHPSYEIWVRELLASVRRHLRAPAI